MLLNDFMYTLNAGCKAFLFAVIYFLCTFYGAQSIMAIYVLVIGCECACLPYLNYE